ncbi:MAG: hypothetical protein WCH75_17155, partial [Candidatus Binatia bacterium]
SHDASRRCLVREILTLNAHLIDITLGRVLSAITGRLWLINSPFPNQSIQKQSTANPFRQIPKAGSNNGTAEIMPRGCWNRKRTSHEMFLRSDSRPVIFDR